MKLLLLMLEIVMVIVVLVAVRICGYDRRCPHLSQRGFRVHSECSGNSSVYNCLYNTKNKTYTEFCEENEEARAGLKYVISGTYRNVKCSEERYQPFTFWTNRSTNCLYLKSPCSDTGQLVFDNTSTIGDSTCRCDYTRHYAFVSPPRNLCSCKPSVEDCSCYVKQCPNNTTLSPDYECMYLNSTEKSFNCNPVIHTCINGSDMDTFQNVDEQCEVWKWSGPIGLTVMILVVFIVIPGIGMRGRNIKLCVAEKDQIVLNENMEDEEHKQTTSNEVLEIENLPVSLSYIHRSDMNGCTPVMKACREGNINVVHMLIDNGADINRTDNNGKTLLYWSCVSGNIDLVNLLINIGCDVHTPRCDGKTPLMVACCEGHLSIVKLLINQGTNINSIDKYGKTAFYFSCVGGNIDIIDLLIDKGCDMHKPGHNGKTPLMVACCEGHLSIVKLLVKKGADINTTDKKGNTPFNWSCIGGNSDIVQLFMNISSGKYTL